MVLARMGLEKRNVIVAALQRGHHSRHLRQRPVERPVQNARHLRALPAGQSSGLRRVADEIAKYTENAHVRRRVSRLRRSRVDSIRSAAKAAHRVFCTATPPLSWRGRRDDRDGLRHGDSVGRRRRSREGLCAEDIPPPQIRSQRNHLLEAAPPRRPLGNRGVSRATRRHSTSEEDCRYDMLGGLRWAKSSLRAKQNRRSLSSCAFDVCGATGHRGEPPLVTIRG